MLFDLNVTISFIITSIKMVNVITSERNSCEKVNRQEKTHCNTRKKHGKIRREFNSR